MALSVGHASAVRVPVKLQKDFAGQRVSKARAVSLRGECRHAHTVCEAAHTATGRRSFVAVSSAVAASLVLAQGGFTNGTALALSGARRALRETRIAEEEYKTMDSGLKYYDLKIGGGRLAEIGDRVTVHYVAKWKGITFMTSRQGLGVTGGTPYGFDVGSSDRGYVLKGLDLGVQGMRVGGERQLLVPPELAYGNKGVQEIPPGATLEVNIQLLSIKESAFGTGVKLVEG